MAAVAVVTMQFFAAVIIAARLDYDSGGSFSSLLDGSSGSVAQWLERLGGLSGSVAQWHGGYVES